MEIKDSSGKWIVKVQNDDVLYSNTKTQSSNRTIVITEDAYNRMLDIVKMTPNSEYLFVNQDGKRIRGNSFNKRLKSICKKAGVIPKSTHKIRRYYATTLLKSGANDAFVATQMGHTDISTTRRFYQYDNDSMEDRRGMIIQASSYRKTS
jgi:integrase